MDEKKINTKIVLDKSAGEELGDVVGLSNYYTKAEAQAKIDSEHKLDADLVDDSNSTNKFVSTQDKTTWNGKSVVVPNPTMSGDEQALNGIEINGIKFKSGGETPHLYRHDIKFSTSLWLCTLYTTDSTAFTTTTFKEYVNTNGAVRIQGESSYSDQYTPSDRRILFPYDYHHDYGSNYRCHVISFRFTIDANNVITPTYEDSTWSAPNITSDVVTQIF